VATVAIRESRISSLGNTAVDSETETFLSHVSNPGLGSESNVFATKKLVEFAAPRRIPIQYTSPASAGYIVGHETLAEMSITIFFHLAIPLDTPQANGQDKFYKHVKTFVFPEVKRSRELA
jgi:hypothetical protein